jgi:hypothetical protein
MVAIGDGDMDDAENQELPPVDHAVMAHLNINNSSDGNLNLGICLTSNLLYIYLSNSSNDNLNLDTLNLDEPIPVASSIKSTKRQEKDPPVVQVRDNYIPDFHEKTRMRYQTIYLSVYQYLN